MRNLKLLINRYFFNGQHIFTVSSEQHLTGKHLRNCCFISGRYDRQEKYSYLHLLEKHLKHGWIKARFGKINFGVHHFSAVHLEKQTSEYNSETT